jgi:hypothetical protein
MKKGIFVAATGQHIGKTTTCLGLFAHLQKRYKTVGYLKPVGQEASSGVDKDILLFQSQFGLADPDPIMSPVLLPKGFTRDFLDGKIERGPLLERIFEAYTRLTNTHPMILVEGTGHMGVGSIINLNNAQVAAHLKTPVILVASAGIGSTFDEIALNKSLLDLHRIPLAGVILNRLLPEKKETVLAYIEKALQTIGVPLLGAIPYSPFLSSPTLLDFELLFKTKLLFGQEKRLLHLEEIRMATAPLDPAPRTLIVTSGGREEILLSLLTRYWDFKITHPGEELPFGLILTGKEAPSASLLHQLEKASIPTLQVPLSNFVVMKMINTTTSKIRGEDQEKIGQAIALVEQHIDWSRFDATMAYKS